MKISVPIISPTLTKAVRITLTDRRVRKFHEEEIDIATSTLIEKITWDCEASKHFMFNPARGELLQRKHQHSGAIYENEGALYLVEESYK